MIPANLGEDVPVVRRGSVGRVGVACAVVLLAALLAVHFVERAGADVSPCKRHSSDSAQRARLLTGSGSSVLVVGDSWAVGLGLDDFSESWPARMDGQVRVAGYSGSGFSAGASECPNTSFAERAEAAVRHGELVLVEGGLNDFDQPGAAVESGFADLMRALSGHRVVIVGPAAAPSRADAVRRVERLLIRLSGHYAVPYIATSDLTLDYLDDRLHLTAEGHREFGDAVSVRLAGVVPTRPAQR